MKSERSQKPKKHSDILRNTSRCVYCATPANSADITIEHMPPRGMFRDRKRLKGLEFASCKSCNEGTKAADAAVAFFSRIDQTCGDINNWKLKEAAKYLKSANDGAPGFVAEILNIGNAKGTLLRTPSGVLVDVVETSVGPISRSLLTVFSAKLGMALYHEHVRKPLPLTGGVHGLWFLNAGLTAEAADAMLKILPSLGTLRMGRLSASGQFDYRYGTDNQTVIAALSHFHGNVHFLTVATAEPEQYVLERLISYSFVKPGELLNLMPKRRSVILMPTGQPESFPSLILP